jgi:hypothetical protein
MEEKEEVRLCSTPNFVKGEFDIMENLGQDVKTIYGTYHW